MNKDSVKLYLKEMQEYIDHGNYGMARATENALYFDLVYAISCGECDDPEGVCFAALKSTDIEFDRGCG